MTRLLARPTPALRPRRSRNSGPLVTRPQETAVRASLRARLRQEWIPFAADRVHLPNMRAQILDRSGGPLTLREVDDPRCGEGQVRVKVSACGVCRTDLHVLDGELTRPKLPLILGHQIVGTVVEQGEGVTSPSLGERVGIPWLGWTDGTAV